MKKNVDPTFTNECRILRIFNDECLGWKIIAILLNYLYFVEAILRVEIRIGELNEEVDWYSIERCCL